MVQDLRSNRRWFTHIKIRMEFIEFVEKMDNETSLNFKGVLPILGDLSIENTKLNNALGLATLYGLYIDVDRMLHSGLPDKMFLFVILHEIAHYKRMVKFGKEHYLEKLSRPDFEDFFEGVIEEEVFADRWASVMYYHLTGDLYPRHLTQQLDADYIRLEYRPYCRSIFNKVQNDEEKYKELIKTILV